MSTETQKLWAFAHAIGKVFFACPTDESAAIWQAACELAQRWQDEDEESPLKS